MEIAMPQTPRHPVPAWPLIAAAALVIVALIAAALTPAWSQSALPTTADTLDAGGRARVADALAQLNAPPLAGLRERLSELDDVSYGRVRAILAATPSRRAAVADPNLGRVRAALSELDDVSYGRVRAMLANLREREADRVREALIARDRQADRVRDRDREADRVRDRDRQIERDRERAAVAATARADGRSLDAGGGRGGAPGAGGGGGRGGR
jgi:hypothetical protein